jgi:hypothetical protein
MIKEKLDGLNASQLKEENKRHIEKQNFNIKQPQLSGDVFTTDNYREK